MLADLTAVDGAALALLIFGFFAYGPITQRLLAERSVNGALHGIRVAWMRAMLDREVRIADTQLLGHLIHSASFFASANMLLIAGLLGLLGSIDETHAALGRLAFVAPGRVELFETKLVALLAVLIAGFLRLSWGIRQLNYTVALIGAASLPGEAAPGEAEEIAAVLGQAINSYNGGIRTYHFAFALLAWLAGPLAFLVATVAVLAGLLWRQCGSRSARAIRARAARLR